MHLPLLMRRQLDAGLLAGVALARVDGSLMHVSKKEFGVSATMARKLRGVAQLGGAGAGPTGGGGKLASWVGHLLAGHPEAAAWVGALYDARVAVGVLRAPVVCESKRLATPEALAALVQRSGEARGGAGPALPPPPPPTPSDPLPRREMAESSAAAARGGAPCLGDALLARVAPGDPALVAAAGAALRAEATAAAYALLHVAYVAAPPPGALEDSAYALPERLREFLAGVGRLVASAPPPAAAPALGDALLSRPQRAEMSRLYAALSGPRFIAHWQAAPLFEPLLFAFLGDGATLGGRLGRVLSTSETAARGAVAVAASASGVDRALLRGGAQPLDGAELRALGTALGKVVDRSTRRINPVYRPDAWAHLPAALGLHPAAQRALAPPELVALEGGGAPPAAGAAAAPQSAPPSPLQAAVEQSSPFLRQYFAVRARAMGLLRAELGLPQVGAAAAAPPSSGDAAAHPQPAREHEHDWRSIAPEILTLARHIVARHIGAAPAGAAAASAATSVAASAAAASAPRPVDAADPAAAAAAAAAPPVAPDAAAAPTPAALAATPPPPPAAAAPSTPPRAHAARTHAAVHAVSALCTPWELAALQPIHADMHALLLQRAPERATQQRVAEWQDTRGECGAVLLASPEGRRLLGNAVSALRGAIRVEAYAYVRQLAVLSPAEFAKRFAPKLAAASAAAADPASPPPPASYPAAGFPARRPAAGDAAAFAQRLVRLLPPAEYEELVRELARFETAAARLGGLGHYLERERRATLARAQRIFGALCVRLDAQFAALLWEDAPPPTAAAAPAPAPASVPPAAVEGEGEGRAAPGGGGVLLLPSSIYRSELGPVPQDHFRIGFGRANLPEGLAVFREWLMRNRA